MSVIKTATLDRRRLILAIVFKGLCYKANSTLSGLETKLNFAIRSITTYLQGREIVLLR